MKRQLFQHGLLAACAALLSFAAAAADPQIYVSGAELLKVAGDKPTAADLPKVNDGKLAFFCSATEVAAPVGTGKLDLSTLQKCDAVRRITTLPDRVIVRRIALNQGECPADDGVLEPARPLDVSFDEVKRRTLLGDGLSKIFNFLAKKADATTGILSTATAKPLQWCLQKKVYALGLDRAIVTVKANYAGAKDDELAVSAKIITGPEERWFLSGDAIVQGASEVKWDSATKTLVAKDKPDQLYLGFNYMFGDVFDRQDAGSLKRVALKLLIQPSRKPFDSFGLGVGYRFADGVFTLEDAQPSGGFMLFGGVFWTRSDALDASGAVIGGKRERSFRLGVSYSLDTLLDWVK